MRRVEDVVVGYWSELVAGKKILLAPWEMEDPRSRPDLFRPVFGLWVGQIADFGWPLDDGSRIHAQAFRRRRQLLWRIHRDAHDPRDLESAIKHVAYETPIPKILLGALGGMLVFEAIRATAARR